jgi:DNA-binding MarR family transcriptional regulator
MTDDAHCDVLVERCNAALHRLMVLTRPQDSDWLALDMGMGQLKAMVVLTEQGRQTVGGLARALNISEPSASLLVDKLVTRGLVGRDTDPSDRRRTLVATTEQGDQLMGRLRRTREDQFTGWLGLLDNEDLQALAQALDALAAAVERERSRT